MLSLFAHEHDRVRIDGTVMLRITKYEKSETLFQ